MDLTVNEHMTERLLQQKLGDLVRWLISHMSLRIKPHGLPVLVGKGHTVKKEE